MENMYIAAGAPLYIIEVDYCRGHPPTIYIGINGSGWGL